MAYRLFLDDERDIKQIAKITGNSVYRKGNWEIARNYQEFVMFLNFHGLPTCVSFDHDLGDSKDGQDCARYLCEFLGGKPLPAWHVHSQNAVGVKEIESVLKSYNKISS